MHVLSITYTYVLVYILHVATFIHVFKFMITYSAKRKQIYHWKDSFEVY